MKSQTTKITSFIMALLVLLSTVSLTVEKHFCGDFLVDISYFGNTNGCADEKGDESCDIASVIEKKNCCKDEIEKVEGQDDLQQETFKKLQLEKQKFLIAFVTSYKNLFLELRKQTVSYKWYSPPNLENNIQILHQVFII